MIAVTIPPSSHPRPLRCLELFAGIGGFAFVAEQWNWQIQCAIDINPHAATTYATHFSHPFQVRSIEGLTTGVLSDFEADLWWVSPPCQPHTSRGRGLDLDDPRSVALRHVVHQVQIVRPFWFILENVPNFGFSRAGTWLKQVLRNSEYQFHERQVCPTELGIPNRRRRYYLFAWQSTKILPDLHSPSWLPRTSVRRPAVLEEVLDKQLDQLSELVVDKDLHERYARAMHLVSADRPADIASCFTSAYGKSPIRSGSYVVRSHGVRRFAPLEIAHLLGFPETFRFPSSIPTRQAWKLVGNSLSLPVVTKIIQDGFQISQARAGIKP